MMFLEENTNNFSLKVNSFYFKVNAIMPFICFFLGFLMYLNFLIAKM